MKNVELYYNGDRSAYAILVSRGWGSGWSTANPEYPEIAYDKKVLEWYCRLTPEFFEKFKCDFNGKNEEYKEARDFFDNLGYYDIYFGGFRNDMIRWIPVESIWRIEEYDGAERVEFFDLKGWNQFR